MWDENGADDGVRDAYGAALGPPRNRTRKAARSVADLRTQTITIGVRHREERAQQRAFFPVIYGFQTSKIRIARSRSERLNASCSIVSSNAHASPTRQLRVSPELLLNAGKRQGG